MQLPLYRRSEVLLAARNAGTIFLVEGEGKADRLRGALGESRSKAAVTTIAHGSSAPMREQHIADFAGAKRVYVLADSDAAGRHAAEIRAQLLARAHRSMEVRVADFFPDRSDGSDVADWLGCGHTVDELPRVAAAQLIAQDAASELDRNALAPISDLLIIDAADLMQRPYASPRFLVEHLIPERGLTLLSADTGAGKSSFLLHAALSIAFALPVANRFPVSVGSGLLLYFNGEMSTDVLGRFIHANAAGIGVDASDLAQGKLLFEGEHGLADFFLGLNDRRQAERLELLLDRVRPSLLVFDTFRALFDADESKTKEVRTVFQWLRTLSERFGCSVVVAHHIRKLSQVSNQMRERVSGSRDLIGAVDVHIALRSLGGQPANSILIDKTRTPVGGICAGTEWPLEASWLDGEPPISAFIAGEPSRQNATSIETAQQEILDMLAAEGPKSIADLGAAGGSRKRGLDALRQAETVVPVGKRGRALIFDRKGAGEQLFDSD